MKYLLSEANQNTFVLFDCLKDGIKDPNFFEKVHEILKKEKRDDALILIANNKCANSINPIEMLVFGLDGTFGEFCGNGALSCAAYLFDHYAENEFFALKTKVGSPLLRKEKDKYIVELPPACLKLNTKFIRRPIQDMVYMEVLEPHLLVNNIMSDDELLKLGRELNHCIDIFPLGINVNAWHVTQQDQLFVKTYERGVQRLTRSCGSGSACCAALYRQQGKVRIKTPGGNLEVSVSKDKITLKGKGTYMQLSNL